MVIIVNKEVDLSKYELRTDLAIESINSVSDKNGIKTSIKNIDEIKVTQVEVDEEGSKKINKKVGLYTTIEFIDVTDSNNGKKVLNVFAHELKNLLSKINIKEDDSCLVIGLGNASSTPDSLGPLSVDNVLVTNHLFELKELSDGFRRVCAINPGVMGTTGIETSDIISSIIKLEKPDLLIVIDALASDSIDRVCKTIQITDAGINPGSGIGNERKEISYETLNIPVIAIGVPMVVDAVTIVSDTINYMEKHFSYNIKNINNPINKLIPTSMQNYLKEKDLNLTNNEKTYFFGKLGNLTNNEKRSLIFDVLTPIGNNLMVTPKEVDFVIDKLSNLISTGINNTIHEINI